MPLPRLLFTDRVKISMERTGESLPLQQMVGNESNETTVSLEIFSVAKLIQKMVIKRKARTEIVQKDKKSTRATTDLKREKSFFNARD